MRLKFYPNSLLLLLCFLPLVACQAETSADTKNVTAAKIMIDEATYKVLEKPLQVSTGDKIEVMELFWYGCGHCFAMEPHVKKWHSTIPKNAEFVKMPTVFSKPWKFHAQAFYTMETLGVLEQADDAFFKRLHVAKNPISNPTQLVDFLINYELEEKDIMDAFNSFAVDRKLRNAERITVESTIRGVPGFLVDGKYLTSAQLAGGAQQVLALIDQLIAKAASER